MARGRLIWPVMAEFAQLDTSATAADPDGAGELTAGYDEDFREPVIVPPGSGSARGTVNRVETTLRCAAQYEPRFFEELRMLPTGRSPDSRIQLVLHYKDLESRDLIDADGQPRIRVNDRLAAIRDYRTDALIMNIPNPPGLYVTEVEHRSFGLSSLTRNLLVLTLDERQVSGFISGAT